MYSISLHRRQKNFNLPMKERVQFTTAVGGGSTLPTVIEIFSLKMPLNASKVPKELFNSYQNV